MTADVAVRVPRLAGLVPEQIASAPTSETHAALIDQWGRVHGLRAATVIGRDGDNAIAVSQASVSRRHAEVARDPSGASWTIADLGSRNGTFVEGARLAPRAPAPIGDRQVLQIGEVGFLFVLDRRTLATARSTESIRATAAVAPGHDPRRMRLSPPTTEGAGMVTLGEQTISLGSAQFALLWLLAERAIATRDQPAEVRGFVRSIELLTELPWNTPSPDDNHLKQQIRRVRKALAKLGLEEVIEARHGFGYRLTVEPLLGQ